MKGFSSAFLIALAGLVPVAATHAAAATSDSSAKVLPVLVQVDAHGHISNATPATPLDPGMSHMLNDSLHAMIKRPATDKQGHPIPSQFIINLAVKLVPAPGGKYAASFGYVSTKPVPAGSWYWIHTKDHRLALASRSGQTIGGFDPQNYYNGIPVQSAAQARATSTLSSSRH